MFYVKANKNKGECAIKLIQHAIKLIANYWLINHLSDS